MHKPDGEIGHSRDGTYSYRHPFRSRLRPVMPQVYAKCSVGDDRPGVGPCRGLRHPSEAGHAGQGLGELLDAYASLARHVASRQDRLVITHGEPHGGNVMTMSSGLVLVDWDTVLLAPPERDGSGTTSPKSAATSACSTPRTARQPTPPNRGGTSGSFCIRPNDGPP